MDNSQGSSSDSESSLEPEIFVPTDYPVTLWVAGSSLTPGLVDTVSTNTRIMLNALGVPVTGVLYFRMRSTSRADETSHLFIAVDDKERVIRVSPARLSLITGMINATQIKQYTASMTSDPLGALLLKVGGGVGERISRFPPIFGFRAPHGERQIYDRRPEIESLRRDGYIALTFLPIPGVDHRIQLSSEIATLWGYSLAGHDKRWPDLLILRNDNPERDDLGGVPDETWLNHALSRVLEDHLPVVEIEGLWMGSLQRTADSRSRVYYAVLDWIRMKRLPYVTARTFHCYVRRDLSCVVALGSIRDRNELVEWLEAYPFGKLGVARVQNEATAAAVVFGGRPSRDVAVKDSGTDNWTIIRGPQSATSSAVDVKKLESELRTYYGNPQTCSALGSPLTAKDVPNLKLPDLLKIVRIAECEAAAGVCLLPGSKDSASGSSWLASHRAYRSAVRTQILRIHDTLGVYRLGPYESPFFAFDVHSYMRMPPDSRYQPVVSQLRLAPEIGEAEDNLLKSLVGTVWLLSVKESATATTGETQYDVIQVASDREGELVRKTLFETWKSGYLIGTWCRVMLTHRETLSISVAGGTVDPLIAHAGDSVVDGSRFLTVAERAVAECS